MDGYRPSITLLIGDFLAYLVDRRKRELRKKPRNNIQTNTIPWIEQLLENPIEDGRKYARWRILCPYLVNVKKLEYEESYKILKTWLDKCMLLLKNNCNQY